MNSFQARRMGITLPKMIGAARRIRGRGDEVTSEAVLHELLGDAEVTANLNAAMDWESILDFIERLLPLILKIIDLFT